MILLPPHRQHWLLFALLNVALWVVLVAMGLDELIDSNIQPGSPDFFEILLCYLGYALFALPILFFLPTCCCLAVAAAADTRRAPGLRLWFGRLTGLLAFLAALILSGCLAVEFLVWREYEVHFYEFNVWAIIWECVSGSQRVGIQPSDLRQALLIISQIIIAEIAAWFLLRALVGRLARVSDVSVARISLGVMLVLAVTGLGLHVATLGKVVTARHDHLASMPLRDFIFFDRQRPYIRVQPATGPGGYPSIAAAAPLPTLVRPRNIVMVMFDSLRADHFTPVLMPRLTEFSRSPGSLVLPWHYSTSFYTEEGTFGLWYGLEGYRYDSFMRDHVAPYPFALLRKLGYRTALITASYFNRYPNDFLGEIFDETILSHDESLAGEVEKFLEARRLDHQKYLLIVFHYGPHYPFPSRPGLQRYQPSKWNSSMNRAEALRTRRNRYCNSVLQADEHFGQLLELFQPELDKDNLIMAVTADHGSEMEEHRVMGQGKSSFWNEKVRIPMILHVPGLVLSWDDKNSASSHKDIWPTLFASLGVIPLPDPGFYSDGRPLGVQTPDSVNRERQVVFAGREFPYVDIPNAILDSDRTKYWFRVAGREPDGHFQFDLIRTTAADDEPFPVGARETARFRDLSAVFEMRFWRFFEPANNDAKTTRSGR